MNQIEVYWLTCLLLMAVGSILTASAMWNVVRRSSQQHVLLNFLHFLIPDAVMYLNYISLFAYSLLNHGLPEGFACNLSAFFIIATVVAVNLGICFHSYHIKHFIISSSSSMPSQHLNSKKPILRSIALSWLVGLLVGLSYVLQDQAGSFKNLYCMSPTFTLENSLLVLLSFVASLGSIMYHYGQVYKHTRRIRTQIYDSISMTTGTSTVSDLNDPLLFDIMKRAGLMMAMYYIAWSGVTVNALITLWGGSLYPYPLWRDMVASGLIKVGSIMNSLLCLQHFWKKRQQAETQRTEGARLGDRKSGSASPIRSKPSVSHKIPIPPHRPSLKILVEHNSASASLPPRDASAGGSSPSIRLSDSSPSPVSPTECSLLANNMIRPYESLALPVFFPAPQNNVSTTPAVPIAPTPPAIPRLRLELVRAVMEARSLNMQSSSVHN
eukprot:TRINITY_DN5383_c0_g1_i2.p1 TRINITY_DN5383_c0_g1~~TRINITY_DN5383_c0_g1_i2.p1  ORF type:complete len:439 (-),score=33.78 TRINITY_DN5383_c0_g1_i2:135-1451(-)